MNSEADFVLLVMWRRKAAGKVMISMGISELWKMERKLSGLGSRKGGRRVLISK